VSVAPVELRGLRKTYGELIAVDDVTLTVRPGDIFGYLGPNGAGKTTSLRMMLGLIAPTAGDVRLFGEDPIADPVAALADVAGFVEEPAFYPYLTGRRNLEMLAALDGGDGERIDEVLRLVELDGRAGDRVRGYSHGMRQRLGLAAALMRSPKLLLLDEPTTGLDPVSRVAVWEMLSKIKAERNLTILITTHYMDEADKLCDRIAIVDHGELKALDSPLKLKASIPGKNVLEATFSATPPDWEARLQRLPDVETVSGEDNIFRLKSQNGPATTLALMELAARSGVTVHSLSVQSTTLDDVFVHYTGRALRDALQEANPSEGAFALRRN